MFSRKYRFFLIRDDEERVKKVIYGEVELLYIEEESDPVIWQEELICDSSGKVQQLITTFPDVEAVTIALVR